jgi:hypothetical protein
VRIEYVHPFKQLVSFPQVERVGNPSESYGKILATVLLGGFAGANESPPHSGGFAEEKRRPDKPE